MHRHGSALRRLSEVLGRGVTLDASGEGPRAASLFVPGAQLAILLLDGRVLVGHVDERVEARALVRPWGCATPAVLELGEVAVASTVRAMWDATARISTRMRREWR